MPKASFSARYDRFRAMLADARKTAGLTQSALAIRLRKPQSFVSKYENGERRLDVVEFLDVAAAIGVEPSAFIRKLSRVSD